MDLQADSNCRKVWLLKASTYFIVDNIESKYTDSIDVLLLAPATPPPVVAFGYTRETVAHWVDYSLKILD